MCIAPIFYKALTAWQPKCSHLKVGCRSFAKARRNCLRKSRLPRQSGRDHGH